MKTDDILSQIAESNYPLAGAFEDAMSSHGGSRIDFSETFAIEVACRYLQDTLSFDIANCAINALSTWTPQENFTACSWAVYRAFDEGEYLHPGQTPGTNEDLYTRPMLRKAMSEFFPTSQR